MPITENQRREDYLARRRDYLVQIREAHRQNSFEFYKQSMILSVAGLGFNLSPLGREANAVFTLPPDNAWEISLSGFILAVILTLLIFYVQSWYYSYVVALNDPDAATDESDEMFENRLGMALNILTLAMTASFTIAVIAAIISVVW